MAKLKWRVSPKPTGRYKSFVNRAWPSATVGDDHMAVQLDGKKDGLHVSYRSAIAETTEITIRVACYQKPANRPMHGKFRWFTMRQTATGLKAAKRLAQEIVDKHPEWFDEVDTR